MFECAKKTRERMKFMQFKIIFNLRQRKLQCTNANAFDNHQANQCREMMNTHYIRSHCRFFFGSSAIAMRLRIRTPPLLLRDTYTKRTSMYRRTHHWARSHSSYLKRRHSLAAMYTKPYFYCFSFALVSFVRFHFHVVRSFVRSFIRMVAAAIQWEMLAAMLHTTAQQTVMACAHTHYARYIQMCDDVVSLVCVCACLRAYNGETLNLNVHDACMLCIVWHYTFRSHGVYERWFNGSYTARE